MRVGLAQISPHLGNIKKNLELHLQSLDKARKERVDLLIFPELSLTGYTLKDLVEEVAIRPEEGASLRELKKASRDIAIVLGFVEEKEKGIFYNSAAYLSGGEITHIHRKVFLPTYGMFEEGRFFAGGKNFKTFSTPFGRMGLMICRDFLHYGACYLLFAGGADIIIVISAAPGRGMSEKNRLATSHMWELMGEAMSRFSTSFVIYCNRVGFEDGKVFAGGSFIFNPLGQLIVRAAYFDKDFVFEDIRLESLQNARKKWPFRRDDRPEVISEALKRIVGAYED